MGSPGGSVVKNLPANAGDAGDPNAICTMDAAHWLWNFGQTGDSEKIWGN